MTNETQTKQDIGAPRSMNSGKKNVLRPNDSASLWNYTLSPGWTQEEVEILRQALMKFGIGNWSKIIQSNCLIGKTVAQMNLQTQRLLGQQSTAEFANLHIDPNVINEMNSKKQGPEVKRKNGFIVNTGGKVSREEVRERIKFNKANYEMPESEWSKIELVVKKNHIAEIDKKKLELLEAEQELRIVQKEIAEIEAKIALIDQNAEIECNVENMETDQSLKQKCLDQKPIEVEGNVEMPEVDDTSSDFDTERYNYKNQSPMKKVKRS